tara:strand:- start:176 stop:367 length:192 start_codon:yes stop_codon:yes gene_type:complete
MRRGKRKIDPKDYILMRIDQLKDERFRSNDTMDRMWFLKVIEELNYVLEVIDKIGVDDEKRRD